jgi:plastocyanin
MPPTASFFSSGCSAIAILALSAAAPLGAQTGTVSGRITVVDKGDRPAEDVGQAVVWLDGGRPVAVAPAQPDMSTENKQFLPHVLVVPAGSSVVFPNHDPFNHNVFSLSEAGAFDLGLYGRGDGKSAKFDKAGIVRVYCNVHATMSGFILVIDSPYFAQPSGDGSFSVAEVPPGDYTLHAWHERAKEVTQLIQVKADGLSGVALQLDARGYKFKSHPNKYGQPYSQQGRRY